MKVCFVSYDYPPNIIGGTGTYAKELVAGLKAEGHQVTVITRSGKNQDAGVIGLDVNRIGLLGRLLFIRRVGALLPSVVESRGVDLIHFNEPYLLTKSNLSVPIVTSFHNLLSKVLRAQIVDLRNSVQSMHDLYDLTLSYPVGSVAEILTAHSSDTIICPSPMLASEIVSFCHVNQKKVHFVPNGMDLKKFDSVRSENSEILTSYGLERDSYLLFVGRFHPLKGPQYLIRAFEAIRNDFPNLKLVLVGSGIMEQRLKKQASRRIVFTGQINNLEDKKSLIENSIALVIPSVFEGMPMVALEALACGKPVVATATGAIPSMVKHKFNGYLVKPKDWEGIQKALEHLLDNPKVRDKMGSRSRDMVQNFSIENMVRKTIQIYEHTMAEYQRSL